MKIAKYVYKYDKFILVKFYHKNMTIQKMFKPNEDALAIKWRNEQLKSLGKQGRFHGGLNKYNLPKGILLATDRGRKIVKVSGGYLNGKHLSTTIGIASRGLESALRIAINKKKQFKKMKEEKL